MVNRIKEIFEEEKYSSIFSKENSDICQGLTCIKESEPKVIDIYLSDCQDELFFIVDAREYDEIEELCKAIDREIVSFVNFGCANKQAVKRFKYNIVQLVLHTSKSVILPFDDPLNISRKILISCSESKDKEEKADNELLKIPFYLPTDDLNTDLKIERDELNVLLPKDTCKFLFIDESSNYSNIEQSVIELRIQEIRGWLGDANINS